ncbi:MAG: hypothetical protein KC448_09945 [Yoonia sp.]|nr:hypothetical protein [Yoonia sp.]
MNAFEKLTAIAILGPVVSACGGSQSVLESQLERAEDYERMIDRVSRIYPTGAGNMEKVTGSASFTGTSVVGVNPRTDYAGNLIASDAILIGDANVAVNFDRGSVSGSMTNLFGANAANQIDDYSGEIALSGGSIGGAVHNDISADYAGTIRGNGDTIVLSGEMDGLLLGNPSGLAHQQLSGSS